MAVVSKRLAKGVLSTTATTLYTVPSNTTTMVKALSICNGSSTAVTVTFIFAGTNVIWNYSVKGNDTLTIPFMDQILNATETIIAATNTAGNVSYYISGKEVT